MHFHRSPFRPKKILETFPTFNLVPPPPVINVKSLLKRVPYEYSVKNHFKS